MDSTAPRRRAETALEYALFAAILIMTVVGTFLYNAIVEDPLLARFTTYLIVTYLVFLTLAFGQLNALHRRRVRVTAKPQPVTYAVKKQRPVLGLTSFQLAMAAFVFATACVTFTWALSITH